ncbi:MAG TPA: glycosyltransferase family 87 protein, partial [Anaerolineales bacterium]|nr:glycosyltransferase family 87 protein [Anaerolineales bacterium]
MIKINIQKILRLLSDTRPQVWLFAGFLIVYVLYFIIPIFFSSQVMQFPTYVPVMRTIGGDLSQILDYSKSWAILRDTPYIGENPYPPFVAVFFTPFLFIPFSLAYKFIVFLSLLFFVLGIVFLTVQFKNDSNFPFIFSFVFFTGLFSYGLHFELERGQFNLIAMFFCYMAVWVYHSHNKFRYLAYILFALSVQLKLYPLIFIVMFVSDWKDWGRNVKRLLLLCVGNFALFFILGTKIFSDFVAALRKFMLAGSVGGSHSIRAFVHMLVDLATENNWIWMRDYSPSIQLILLIIVLTCIFVVLVQTFKQNSGKINPQLLLACAL